MTESCAVEECRGEEEERITVRGELEILGARLTQVDKLAVQILWWLGRGDACAEPEVYEDTRGPGLVNETSGFGTV